ncbi:MAG: hypothetical protein JETCAE03_35910 [Ignavibacteriaceae bacterium]|jgi:LPS O-antigen subunit length determinant protein (WzzB/FepE family)|nr:MAG: hypothetical protein JETCAE03_35910 [Ignavibacteriaceae bacterium]
MENQTLLDQLEIEVDKLKELLTDRQDGLFTWWEFLVKQLNTIVKIATKLGLKNDR